MRTRENLSTERPDRARTNYGPEAEGETARAGTDQERERGRRPRHGLPLQGTARSEYPVAQISLLRGSGTNMLRYSLRDHISYTTPPIFNEVYTAAPPKQGKLLRSLSP